MPRSSDRGIRAYGERWVCCFGSRRRRLRSGEPTTDSAAGVALGRSPHVTVPQVDCCSAGTQRLGGSSEALPANAIRLESTSTALSRRTGSWPKWGGLSPFHTPVTKLPINRPPCESFTCSIPLFPEKTCRRTCRPEGRVRSRSAAADRADPSGQRNRSGLISSIGLRKANLFRGGR